MSEEQVTEVAAAEYARVIDYTKPYWGHAYTFLGEAVVGPEATLMGWCSPQPKVGDLMRFVATDGGTTTYRVVEIIEAFTNPPDMYHARISWVSSAPSE